MNAVQHMILQVKNWTCRQYWDSFYMFMKRKLKVQVAFEPSRLANAHLHQAYELIVPELRRRIRETEPLNEFLEEENAARQATKEEVAL